MSHHKYKSARRAHTSFKSLIIRMDVHSTAAVCEVALFSNFRTPFGLKVEILRVA